MVLRLKYLMQNFFPVKTDHLSAFCYVSLRHYSLSCVEWLANWHCMVDHGWGEALVPAERSDAKLSSERMHSTGNGRSLQQRSTHHHLSSVIILTIC